MNALWKKAAPILILLAVVGLAGVFPSRLLAQDKVEEMAKRIQELERENATLRLQIEAQKVSQNYTIPQRPIPERPARQEVPTPDMTQAQRDLLAEVNRLRPKTPPQIETKMPELTAEQRELLEEANALRDGRPSPKRQRELYREELAFAQKYYDHVSKQFDGGRSTLEEFSRARRQLYTLKRELAGLEGDRSKLKKIIEEEMALVSRLLKEAQKRIEIGTAATGSEADLQREVLKLKRELLAYEGQ